MSKVKQGQWLSNVGFRNQDTVCNLGMITVILRPTNEGYEVGVANGGYGRWLKEPVADLDEAKKAGLKFAKRIIGEIAKMIEQAASAGESGG